jgi:hypothetical protein
MDEYLSGAIREIDLLKDARPCGSDAPRVLFCPCMRLCCPCVRARVAQGRMAARLGVPRSRAGVPRRLRRRLSLSPTGPNYLQDYRPLVQAAKEAGAAVVCANAPRRCGLAATTNPDSGLWRARSAVRLASQPAVMPVEPLYAPLVASDRCGVVAAAGPAGW